MLEAGFLSWTVAFTDKWLMTAPDIWTDTSKWLFLKGKSYGIMTIQFHNVSGPSAWPSAGPALLQAPTPQKLQLTGETQQQQSTL